MDPFINEFWKLKESDDVENFTIYNAEETTFFLEISAPKYAGLNGYEQHARKAE